MSPDKIESAIKRAIAEIKDENPVLDFSRVHERSIAHRLALHMEPLFSEWDIDCEYDRDGELQKKLDGIVGCDSQKKTDAIIPDIIVHHRGNGGRDNNLLVIEMKKNSVRDRCDANKLKLLTKRDNGYAYQAGLYINIKDGEFKLAWYMNGGEVKMPVS